MLKKKHKKSYEKCRRLLEEIQKKQQIKRAEVIWEIADDVEPKEQPNAQPFKEM